VIISFSGLDGSGKSTLASEVAAELGQLGMPARLGRPQYRGNSIVKEYCLLRYGDEHSYYPNLDSNFYLSTLALDWMDWWLHEVVCHVDQVFCCDRYIVDVFAQAVQYKADLGFLKHLLLVMPRPELSFYLEITPEQAAERVKKRCHPPPHRLESLPELRRLRDSYAEVERLIGWEFIRLDASRPLSDVIGSVMGHVKVVAHG
jgi:thymidylate kinase